MVTKPDFEEKKSGGIQCFARKNFSALECLLIIKWRKNRKGLAGWGGGFTSCKIGDGYFSHCYE